MSDTPPMENGDRSLVFWRQLVEFANFTATMGFNAAKQGYDHWSALGDDSIGELERQENELLRQFDVAIPMQINLDAGARKLYAEQRRYVKERHGIVWLDDFGYDELPQDEKDQWERYTKIAYFAASGQWFWLNDIRRVAEMALQYVEVFTALSTIGGFSRMSVPADDMQAVYRIMDTLNGVGDAERESYP